MWEFSTEGGFQARLDWARNFVATEIVVLDLLHGHHADRGNPTTVSLFKSLRDRVKEYGLWGANLGIERGGSSLSVLERVLLDEAIGVSRWAPTVFGHLPHTAFYAELIERFGTARAREAYVDGIIEGDLIVSYALNEPYVGGTKDFLRTSANAVDDGWSISGEKWFIDDASFADIFIVFARTDTSGPLTKQFSLFLVSRQTEGIEIVSSFSLAGHQTHVSNYGHVRFTEAIVPGDSLLGGLGGAYEAIRSCSSPPDLRDQGLGLGIMGKCLEMTLEHCVTHISKQGPIAQFQSAQITVAQMSYRIKEYRLMLLMTAWEIDQDGVQNGSSSLLAVKAALPGTLGFVVSKAMHLHGALGVSSEMPFGDWRAWADALSVSEGATEAYWSDLGRWLLEGTDGRDRYRWPAEHIPTSTQILRESTELARGWFGRADFEGEGLL